MPLWIITFYAVLIFSIHIKKGRYGHSQLASQCSNYYMVTSVTLACSDCNETETFSPELVASFMISRLG